MTSTPNLSIILAQLAISVVLAAVLGFASAFALQQRNVENARSDERRRNERVDRAVRLQVLAFLKAEANEIRFAYTSGIMELSVMSNFHNRLRERLIEKDVPQAFPDEADVLYGALAACDFAMAVQRLNEDRWKQADDEAKKEGGKPVSSYELERRPKIVKGIWTPPFLKLEEVFKRVEDTDELREFAKARDERAEWEGRRMVNE